MSRIKNLVQQEWFALLVLLALILFPFIVGWLTGSTPTPARTRDAGASTFWQSVFIQVFIFAILAMSYNLMFGFTGIVSFGHALFFGLGAYGVGIAVKHLGLDFGFAVLLTLLVSALLGLITGLVSLRIKGVYFAIFTLAFAQIFFILAKNRLFVNITGAEDGFFFNVPDWLNPVPKNRLIFYYITLFSVVVVYLFMRRLVNSPTGRVFQAIRENESRAKTMGYNTLVYKLVSIIIAGMVASYSGTLHVILNNKQPLPELFGAEFTVDPLLASLLGGTGSFGGPILGASFLHLSENALRNLVIQIGQITINVGDYWALVLGIMFVVIVMVLPQGIVGAWQHWRARTQKKA